MKNFEGYAAVWFQNFFPPKGQRNFMIFQKSAPALKLGRRLGTGGGYEFGYGLGSGKKL